MNIITGNLWDEIDKADLILVTTNAMVNSDGHLVMGRGAAREAKDRFPEAPARFGKILAEWDAVGDIYGVLRISVRWPPRGDNQHFFHLGAFQTKRHWRDGSDSGLIRHSAEMLAEMAGSYQRIARIAMNFPGIGLGGLSEADVLPLLKDLPDNVWIYKK